MEGMTNNSQMQNILNASNNQQMQSMSNVPNNQQFGNNLTQQQRMMAQRQAYMQQMRQQQMAQQPQRLQAQVMQAHQQNQQIANQSDFANKNQIKIQWKFDEGVQVNNLAQQPQKELFEQPIIPQAQQPMMQQNMMWSQNRQNINAQQNQQVQQQLADRSFIGQSQQAQQQSIEQNLNGQQNQQNQTSMNEEDELKGLKIEHNGEIIDLEHMSLAETRKFKEKLLKEREEVLAKLNMILARDPNLNPVRLEDFPYYEAVKKIQKGV